MNKDEYKYFCITENTCIREIRDVDDVAPSECVNNNLHTVDWNSLTLNRRAIRKEEIGLSNILNTKDNLSANTDPSTTNDSTEDYSIGSTWINQVTGAVWVCTSNLIDSAVWISSTETANAQNIGSNGVGIYKNKSSNTLNFKKINNGSNKISITDDTGNNEIDIDLIESNINHSSLSNLSVDSHTQYALLAGRSGGQTLNGGTGAGNNLTLRSTTNGTKGNVICTDALRITDSTLANNSSTGALIVTGGIGIQNGIYANGAIRGDEIRCHSFNSSQANPALMGFDGMSSGEANRFQFGDGANVWQNSYGGRQTMGSYWGIEIRGNRRGINPPSFATGTTSDPNLSIINENNIVGLRIYGHSSQTENIQEWVTNSATVLGSFDNNGNMNITGNYQINGTSILNASQTLTNKTLTSTSNNVTAKSLHSATTSINVSSATAPSSGQVLTATSSTSATWQTPSGGGSGDVTGPGSSIDMGLVRFNGTSGKIIESVGIRHYGASATDPFSPTPQAGDKYYNTTINYEMQYDASRGKWLSVAVFYEGSGLNGNTSGGSYYKRFNGMRLSSSTGPYVPKGTIVRLGYTTSNSVNHTLEVLVNGSTVAELNSGGSAQAFDDNVNADFPAGNMSSRNKSGMGTSSNFQCCIYFKLRA